MWFDIAHRSALDPERSDRREFIEGPISIGLLILLADPL